MGKRILVPLRSGDRIEEIIPYLKTVTQPDMRVVFLIHHPANGLKWLQAYCGIMECGLEKTLALRRMVESYSLRMRRQLAQQKAFQACETLHQLNVKLAVEVYRGSLRKALRTYVRNGDEDLVIMRRGIGLRIVGFLRRMVAFWRSFKRPPMPPVRLLRPDTQS